MDISSTTAPRTDQQNFDNYIAGPKTVTISEVKAGSAEQPIEIHLVEFPGQPYKPSKSMRRVLVSAWGSESSTYAGRRMTLYGDPTVRFGSAIVGGIKISHLSNIDGTVKVALTVTRGKREPFTVQPLVEAPKRNWTAELKMAGTDIDAVAALGRAASTSGADSSVLKTLAARWQELNEAAKQGAQVQA